MSDYIPGQRWISHAELPLGLGTVLATDLRTVTLLFTACGETRTYARQSAPLTRVKFAPGDSIRSHEGWSLRVESTREIAGLVTYTGHREDGRRDELEEGLLDSRLQLNRPAERLLTGQIDTDKWFELRYRTLLHANRLAGSDLRGLTGGRTSLIPHQLYIAHEVAGRYAPRVLLADEVGLGKTIEAGMILHQQLLAGLAGRVLIVVPETLLHQWLVEMLRRFNLYCSVFDEPRCLAAEESTQQDNPFHTEQLVLCTLEFLVGHPDRFRQALAGDWDLLVVDEAHHLQWSPQNPSTEYDLVARLAAQTRGVLLLTATPEQLGKASHFARLRLLDPHRFSDFNAFVEEEQGYEPVAATVEALIQGAPLDNSAWGILQATLPEGDNQDLLDALRNANGNPQVQTVARTRLVEHLLDRHGTGRVLFRNTRSAVHGFPERELLAWPLPLPEVYAGCYRSLQASGVEEPQLLLCPERLYQSAGSRKQTHWTRFDPRIEWLVERLRQLRPARVLIITASSESALDIAEVLMRSQGIHAGVFHEGMSIVERDRAAAWFADPESGCQALVCSEIGSEGRNFQFAHHLILFDLPLNPDLLEQRIGRLDRIGQTDTIRVHVPYLENSPQAVMYQWYHQGLSAFEHTCPAGHSVFERLRPSLLEALHQMDEGIEDLPALVDTTRQLHQAQNEALQQGRDRLLEYNSCRPHMASDLQQRALAVDAENTLPAYLEQVFDCHDIDLEDHREGSYILRPGDHMRTASFPGLRPEGMTVTWDRGVALANEDMQFMTWEHPLVTGAMDMILGSEHGNTAVTAIKYRAVKPGTMLLECLYLLECASDGTLQTGRYLPPTIIHTVVDQHGKAHEPDRVHLAIAESAAGIPTGTAAKIVQTYSALLRDMLAASSDIAGQEAPRLLAAARRQGEATLRGEIDRLRALAVVNPNVREEEILHFENRLRLLTESLQSAGPRLDAVRLLVAT